MKHVTCQNLSGHCCDDDTMCPAARQFLDRLQQAVGLAVSMNGGSFEIAGQGELSNAGCTCVRRYHADANSAWLDRFPIMMNHDRKDYRSANKAGAPVKAEHARQVH